MSAIDDHGFPTRTREVALLAQSLDRGTITLGICLGAQLLAVAAGSPVFVGHAGPEIGWGPVELMPEAASDPLLATVPSGLTVLHWHGDTFDLPLGATHLAASRTYANQAFRAGERAWGFQFHLEVDQRAVTGFVDAFGDEARSGARTRQPSLPPPRTVFMSWVRFATGSVAALPSWWRHMSGTSTSRNSADRLSAIGLARQ